MKSYEGWCRLKKKTLLKTCKELKADLEQYGVVITDSSTNGTLIHNNNKTKKNITYIIIVCERENFLKCVCLTLIA